MERSLLGKATSFRTPWLVLNVASCYALLLGVAGFRLTFLAEDYDIFSNQSEAGLGVLLLGNGGHWGPLARLLVLGQTHLFGTWYPGYLAVNGFLLAVGLMAFAAPIARSLDVPQWWVRTAFMQIALVPGVMAVVLLANNGAWAQSVCFAGLAAVFASKGRWLIAVALGFGACLSMSGTGVFWVLLSIGVSGTYILARDRERLRSWWRFALESGSLAFVTLIIGRAAATR